MASDQPSKSFSDQDPDSVFTKTKQMLLNNMTKVLSMANEVKKVIHTDQITQSSWIDFDKRATQIIETLKKDDIKIAVLGSTSTGKSTVINALLGERVVPEGKGIITECAIRISGVDFDNGYWINENEPNEQKDMNSLVAESTKNASGIQIYLPKAKHIFLANEFVIIDSPGIGAKKDLDTCVSKYCKDSDVFVLVINGESAMRNDEREFFVRFRKDISPPNIFILINRWDCCENDKDVDKLTKKHLDTSSELWEDLKLSVPLNKRVFFVSAKTSLESKMQGLGEHVQGKGSNEFETFREVMTECLSKCAVETKFYKHIQSGIDMCVEICNKIDMFETCISVITALEDIFKNEVQQLRLRIQKLVTEWLNKHISVEAIVNEPQQTEEEFDQNNIHAYKEILEKRFISNLERRVTKNCKDDITRYVDSTVQTLNAWVARNVNKLQTEHASFENKIGSSYQIIVGHSLTGYKDKIGLERYWGACGLLTIAACLVMIVQEPGKALKAAFGCGFVGICSSVVVQRTFWDKQELVKTQFIENATQQLPKVNQDFSKSISDTYERTLRNQMEQIKNTIVREEKAFSGLVLSTDVTELNKQLCMLQDIRKQTKTLLSEFAKLEMQVKHDI
ncbi:hypothetical protein DPMN_017091 [Dreissena polymorpha]|uniref:Dynamin N-terminal domain-containing protein n=1 Tax=Dreissena polymorpha TaxID=45954 RepID=A0A9D4NCI2_DREPO|nr:hypothetical protein DPMN_017091 [Dreissena polymorpha]